MTVYQVNGCVVLTEYCACFWLHFQDKFIIYFYLANKDSESYSDSDTDSLILIWLTDSESSFDSLIQALILAVISCITFITGFTPRVFFFPHAEKSRPCIPREESTFKATSDSKQYDFKLK